MDERLRSGNGGPGDGHGYTRVMASPLGLDPDVTTRPVTATRAATPS